MYRPSIADGGRGWLLSLLLQTKPLYHASLALAAYHRGKVLLDTPQSGSEHRVAQENHLAICLEEFQQAIKNVGRWVLNESCPTDSIGILASSVQLVFFEVSIRGCNLLGPESIAHAI